MEGYSERWPDTDALTLDISRLAYYGPGRSAMSEFYGELAAASRLRSRHSSSSYLYSRAYRSFAQLSRSVLNAGVIVAPLGGY